MPLSKSKKGTQKGLARDPALRESKLSRTEFISHVWNCQHLANANKFGHIRRVNTMLGIFVPAVVTPLELLGDSDEEEQ